MIISGIAVVLLAVYFIWFVNASTDHGLHIQYFVNIIPLNVVLVLPLNMIILGREFKPFLSVFIYNFKKCDNPVEVKKAKTAASFAIKCILLAGGTCFLIYSINWLRCLSNPADWGPNLCNVILGLFYSLIFSGVILVLKERL